MKDTRAYAAQTDYSESQNVEIREAINGLRTSLTSMISTGWTETEGAVASEAIADPETTTLRKLSRRFNALVVALKKAGIITE